MPSIDDIYLGNPNLKKANTEIEFTQEQILEFLACKEDPVYFAKKYIKIVSLDEGLVPFDLYPFQEKLISNFHEHSTMLFLMIMLILLFLQTKHPLREIYLVDYN